MTTTIGVFNLCPTNNCVAGGKGDKGDSGGGLTMLRDGAHYVYGVLSTRLANEEQSIRLFTNILNVGHLEFIRKHWQRLLLSKWMISYDEYSGNLATAKK